MSLYLHDGIKKTKTVRDEDLQELGENISNFVNAYEKYLYVLDDKDDKTFIYLNQLKKIAKLIESKRYDELIEEDTLITYDTDRYISIPF